MWIQSTFSVFWVTFSFCIWYFFREERAWYAWSYYFIMPHEIIQLARSQKFPKNWHFLPRYTQVRVCMKGGGAKNVRFTKHFVNVLNEWSPYAYWVNLHSAISKIVFVPSKIYISDQNKGSLWAKYKAFLTICEPQNELAHIFSNCDPFLRYNSSSEIKRNVVFSVEIATIFP